MARRVKPEEVDVQHQGEPGERVPVRGGDRREGPCRRRRGKPPLGYRIPRDVEGVVDTHEAVVEGAREGEEDGRNEARGDGEVRATPPPPFPSFHRSLPAAPDGTIAAWDEPTGAQAVRGGDSPGEAHRAQSACSRNCDRRPLRLRALGLWGGCRGV